MDSPKLVINAGNSVNSNVAQGVTATIATGATLELDGTKSALVDNTHPTDPTYRASILSSGSLVVGAGSIADVQQVGGIDQNSGVGGTVTVANGASLTADHINQNSLVIGAGSTFTLAPSAMDGSPMADELLCGERRRTGRWRRLGVGRVAHSHQFVCRVERQFVGRRFGKFRADRVARRRRRRRKRQCRSRAVDLGLDADCSIGRCTIRQSPQPTTTRSRMIGFASPTSSVAHN